MPQSNIKLKKEGMRERTQKKVWEEKEGIGEGNILRGHLIK